MVSIGAMQQVPVKKEGITRFHFAVNQFVTIARCGDSIGIRTNLLPNFDVINPAHAMRTL